MESQSFLTDPKKDRQVPSLKLPPNDDIPASILFPSSKNPSKYSFL